jgi:hypothetical protein
VFKDQLGFKAQTVFKGPMVLREVKVQQVQQDQPAPQAQQVRQVLKVQ